METGGLCYNGYTDSDTPTHKFIILTSINSIVGIAHVKYVMWQGDRENCFARFNLPSSDK